MTAPLGTTFRIAFLAFAVLAGSACSPVNFTTSASNAKTSGNPSDPVDPGNPGSTGDGAGGGIPVICHDVEAIQRPTKILFVVDTSTSNTEYFDPSGADCDQKNPDLSRCLPPSDPDRAFRAGSIETFFNLYKHKTNFDWGLMHFDGKRTESLINPGGSLSNQITDNPNDMANAISAFRITAHAGGTPYQTALSLAYQILSSDRDIASESVNAQYLVIFISDGFPTDYITYKGFQKQALLNDVAALTNIAPGRVSLSAIYYGHQADPNAINLLKSMAQTGQGQFANANDIAGLKINDVIPGKACQ